jgi:hypothetical protein
MEGSVIVWLPITDDNWRVIAESEGVSPIWMKSRVGQFAGWEAGKPGMTVIPELTYPALMINDAYYFRRLWRENR